MLFALFTIYSRKAVAQPSGGAVGVTGPGMAGVSGNQAALSRPRLVEVDLDNSPRPVVPRPRGSSLPELTHHTTELSVVHTLASVERWSGGRVSPQIVAIDLEIPLIKGSLYVGAEWASALMRNSEGRMNYLPGQPWLKGRIVHTLRDRYVSLGAGLAISPPLAVYDELDPGTRLQQATPSFIAASLQPWDFSSFQDRRFTLRPTIDLRAKTRRLLAQFQQGMDVSILAGRPDACVTPVCGPIGDVQLLSTSALYLGVQPRDSVSLGVEAFLFYLVRTKLPISDRDRSALVVAPNVRYVFRWVEPAISLLVPIGPPLLRAFEDSIAVRVDLRIWLGRR